jgi:chromosome segregation ATPase
MTQTPAMVAEIEELRRQIVPFHADREVRDAHILQLQEAIDQVQAELKKMSEYARRCNIALAQMKETVNRQHPEIQCLLPKQPSLKRFYESELRKFQEGTQEPGVPEE